MDGITVFGTNNNFQILYWIGYVSVGNANAAYSFVTGNNYEVEVINNTLYIDNITTGLSRNPTTTSNTIFGNGSSNYTSPATICYIKKYDSSNNLVLNWIPCYRKADSVPGFYDIINNQFYTNSNSSGTFVCGEDVN